MIMLDENIREKLEDNISKELDKLETLTPGSEEYKVHVEGLNKLYRLGIDDAMADLEFNEKITNRENAEEQQKIDNENREAQQAADRKHRWIQTGLNAGIGIATLITNVLLVVKGFDFEETGTMRSNTFRNLFNGLLKNKTPKV